MNRKIVLGSLLTPLLIGILVLSFDIGPVDASGTIYIRADGSIEPPTAPIFTVDNVTYIFTDNISDEIVIERSSIVVDGSGYSVLGSGSGDGFLITGMENVTIRNAVTSGFLNGIRLFMSNDNSIGNNTIKNNTHGFQISYSNRNIIERNKINSNLEAGIFLFDQSFENVILENRIEDNFYETGNVTKGIGIVLMNYCLENTIYHNAFIHNYMHVIEMVRGANIWDNGYPSGGNYWSNFNCSDSYHGLYQNITGSDGIADAPYFIDENNQDNYPVMEPWKPRLAGDVSGDDKVDVEDIFLLALHYGCSCEDLCYVRDCDVNYDCKIDVVDIYMAALHYGEGF